MGNVILSLLIIALAIYLLAIITDEFFVVSLDRISNRLKLPNNVAGASLMAMGSSAPELAIALIALFREGGAHSDVGIGTIVGSAVFNILIITGISAIVRPAITTWRVVARDVVMYIATITLLLATYLDGTISLPEALAFIGLYVIYIIILFNWNAFAPGKEEDIIKLIETGRKGERDQRRLLSRLGAAAISTGIHFLTGAPKQNYIRTFLVSVILIAFISWFLVEYAVILAENLGLPPLIIALTILAGGTSVPDLIASIVVARQGRGEMAIANAIGSNIFDFAIGLGLPWLIVIVARGNVVHVDANGLWISTIILLTTVILLFLFISTERILSRREGWGLVAVYGVYVIWTWLDAGF